MRPPTKRYPIAVFRIIKIRLMTCYRLFTMSYNTRIYCLKKKKIENKYGKTYWLVNRTWIQKKIEYNIIRAFMFVMYSNDGF